ncbi:hypothetical protein B0H14DRAFT_3531788 [Mycena olivaceomarginata]|nr:hypothetical protein B0H14DRAFT_3531788 [Mycena olivaceomarginata]
MLPEWHAKTAAPSLKTRMSSRTPSRLLRCLAPTSPLRPSTSPPPLTGKAKKKDKKRRCERAKRKADTLESLNSTTPPAPTPRVLDKAARSTPITVTFAADNFRASKPRWTGLAQPLEHPLLAHAHDAEFLKKHMQYADWDGKKTHVILDRKGRIIGVLIAPPLPGEDWDSVLEAATAAMREACDKMSFPASAYHHRRAYAEGEGFPCSFAPSAKNAAAMEELLNQPSVVRMATYPIRERPSFSFFLYSDLFQRTSQALCYPIFANYHTTKQTLLRRNSALRRTFTRSPFAAVTVNLGPVSVSPPHADFGNKADGMCLIGALGAFNADQGGHLVCWDYNLIVRFPPGCSILIPSAVVTHSNTPIQDGEERFSPSSNIPPGVCSAGSTTASNRIALGWSPPTAEDIEQREAERKARSGGALKNFSLWKDVKATFADFSDLTDDESDAERPAKRSRRT